eukprot:444180-Amorphochlora_amoeboformis.AAC.1
MYSGDMTSICWLRKDSLVDFSPPEVHCSTCVMRMQKLSIEAAAYDGVASVVPFELGITQQLTPAPGIFRIFSSVERDLFFPFFRASERHFERNDFESQLSAEGFESQLSAEGAGRNRNIED